MPIINEVKESVHGAGSIVKYSLKTLIKDPHILIYPYMAVAFVLLTSPLVSAFIILMWRKLEQPDLVADVLQAAPSNFLPKLGLVSFSVLYAIFITSFFVVAAS